jgi:hypothetical protein
MKIEYTGSITEIRAVEDCIRATKKYTEGVMSKKHPQLIQGEDFPSRVLHKHYEFYPDTPCIRMSFRYDYRINKATISFPDNRDIHELIKMVPGFETTLSAIVSETVPVNTSASPVTRSVDA